MKVASRGDSLTGGPEATLAPPTVGVRSYALWAKALALPGIQGLVVRRALRYPPDDNVADAVDTAVSLVR
ncbi:Cgl0159 family (beta/alpha)8-fold protein [Nocardia sp. R16R-3T]